MVADKPKKKAVKKAVGPKAPVGRPRKKLGTRVSDLPVVSTLRPRVTRSNQDSLALQRARLQYKRDYPRDVKGVDEYKSRALLDAMADSSRGAIGNRVLGKAKYQLDQLADALLKAKKENKKYTIQDGNVYINPDASGSIGSLIAALEGPSVPRITAGPSTTSKGRKPTSAPRVVGTPGRKTTVKIPKAVPKKPPIARRQIEEEYEETVKNATRIAQAGEDAKAAGDTKEHRKRVQEAAKLYNAAAKKREERLERRQAWEDAQGTASSGSNVASSSGVTADEKEESEEARELRMIETALDGDLSPENRMLLLQRSRFLRKELSEGVSTLTNAQTTHALGLVNDVSLNGVTPEGMRAIQSAEPEVKKAVVKVLGNLFIEEQEEPKTASERPKKAKAKAKAKEPAVPPVVAALQETFDDLKRASDEATRAQLDAEEARQYGRQRPLSEEQLAGQRAIEQIAVQEEPLVIRPRKKPISDTEAARVREVERQRQEAADQEEEVRKENAARIAATRKARRAQQNEEADAAIERGRAIRAERAEENERKAQSSRSMYGPQIEAALAKQAADARIIPAPPPPPPRPRPAPGIPQPTADSIREQATRLKKTQALMREGRFVDPLKASIADIASKLAKAETRPQEGPKIMNEDPLAKALQAQALKMKNKMIEKAIQEETASSGISAAEAARLLEEEAESLRLPPLPAYEDLFRDTASGTTAYQIAGEKYRPSANFRTDPNPISSDVEKRFRYNKPMQNIFKDSPGKFKEVYARPYVPALSDAERAAIGDRDLSIQQEGMTPSTSDRILVPGTYRPALDDHPGPSVEAYGEGLVGGRRGCRSFTGGVLSRLRGMGFFDRDGLDNILYPMPKAMDNKQLLADAKAAYAARGGAMGGTFDGRTDFRVLMDAMKNIRRAPGDPNGGAMGGSVVLSGVPAPMTGGGTPVLYEITFPVQDWKTSSSLRWLRSNGIKPMKKAAKSGSVYKYAIASSKGLKDPYTSDLISRGRKIHMVYGMA